MELTAEPAPRPGVEPRGEFLGAKAQCDSLGGALVGMGFQRNQCPPAVEIELRDLVEHVVSEADALPDLPGQFGGFSWIRDVPQVPGEFDRCNEVSRSAREEIPKAMEFPVAEGFIQPIGFVAIVSTSQMQIDFGPPSPPHQPPTQTPKAGGLEARVAERLLMNMSQLQLAGVGPVA